MRMKVRPCVLLLLGISGPSCAAEPPPPATPAVAIAPVIVPPRAAPSPPADPTAAPIGVNEPKEPEPTRAGLSSDAPVPAAAPSARAAAVLAKIGPEAMKQYRVDVCYHGTFALRWARD